MAIRTTLTPGSWHVRCFTRTLKNLRHLQTVAPELVVKDSSAQGFATRIRMEILRTVHRLRPDSLVLSRHSAVADILRKTRDALPGGDTRDSLLAVCPDAGSCPDLHGVCWCFAWQHL
jgi:hypothetical protein